MISIERAIALVKVFLVLNILFALLLLADDFLKPKSSPQSVQYLVHTSGGSSRWGRSSSRIEYHIITRTENIPVPMYMYNLLEEYDTIQVMKSVIFGINTDIQLNGEVYEVDSVYRYFDVMPFALLFSGLWAFIGLKLKRYAYHKAIAVNLVVLILIGIEFIYYHVMNRYI